MKSHEYYTLSVLHLVNGGHSVREGDEVIITLTDGDIMRGEITNIKSHSLEIEYVNNMWDVEEVELFYSEDIENIEKIERDDDGVC